MYTSFAFSTTDKILFLVFKSQVVCALRSLSIMGGIQNLIICVKMAWSEHLDCGVNIRVNYAVDIYDFALNLFRKLLKKKVCPIQWEKTVSVR